GEAPAPYKIDVAHRYALEALAEANKPAVLAVNKVDLLRDKRRLLPLLSAWSEAFPFKALVPISALAGEGTERLVAELVALLPEGPPLFPEDMVTDRAERWL